MEIGTEQPQRMLECPSYQEWTLPDGRSWTQFYRLNDGFLLRFPGFADYELDASAVTVRCIPVPGTSADTVWHLYHNQVLPLALSHQGLLVFHASAVEIRGRAVAFLGASHKGKSTLAASFASNGFAFLTDDGLVLEHSEEDGWQALPSQPSIRLWSDSQRALMAADAPAAPALEFTTKGRFLSNKDLAFSHEARPLKCLYLLGDGSAAAPTFEDVPPSEALIELVKHSFLLDLDERQMLAEHFDELVSLVGEVPCVRFDYPRRFDTLPEVRACLLADLRGRALK